MKNSAISLLLLLSLVSSCNVTDLEPQSNISVSQFWKTATHAETGLNGVYNAFYAGGSVNALLHVRMLYWGEIRADNFIGNPNQEATMYNMTLNRFSAISSFYTTWNEAYIAINRANNVIKSVPGITDTKLTEKRKAEIVGEARFLRALFYYYLVRVFGDVPLVTEPSLSLEQDLFYAKSPKEAVFQTILDDLRQAEAVLPPQYASNTLTRGRATQGAAKALLTSVYLWRKEYQRAADKAKEVIDSPVYQLEPDFATVFRDNSRESIFEIQFDNATQDNNRFQVFFLPAPVGVYLLRPSAELRDPVKGFSRADRRNISIDTTTAAEAAARTFSSAGQAYVNKYTGSFGPPGTPRISDANQIVLRLADVILMRAEALNELGTNQGEAIALVNRIRDRAFGAGVNPVAPTATQESLRVLIERERYLELAFEGHRWFDLVRTERVDEVLGAKYPELMDPSKWLFPIGQGNINNNPNIEQNPGWL